MCSCMVCEVCLERLHTKHNLRRQVHNLKMQLRVEYRPQMAKYVRSQINTLKAEYAKLGGEALGLVVPL